MNSPRVNRFVWLPVVALVTVVGCASDARVSNTSVVIVSTPEAPSSTVAVATTASAPPTVAATTSPTTIVVSTSPPAPSSTATSVADQAQDPTPPAPPPGAGATPPALGAGSTPHQLPTDDPDASWGDSHSYPAVDIFVHGDDGCGGNVVSPVNGTVSQIRPTNRYDSATDNPAHRGGKTVAVIGDDGVRYYMAHFASIDDNVQPGLVVAAGDHLGIVGTTGRSGACHIHFGISPPCPELEWSVRRGVIDPEPFVASWRDGGDASPVEAVQQWLADNPDGCASASADPNADDA